MPIASSFATVSGNGQLPWQLKQSRFAVLSVSDDFAGRSHMLLAACQAQAEDWINGETFPSSEIFTRGPNKWRIEHRLHHNHNEHSSALCGCTDEVSESGLPTNLQLKLSVMPAAHASHVSAGYACL